MVATRKMQDAVGRLRVSTTKDECRIVGPYHPIGDVEWMCKTHQVEAVLLPDTAFASGGAGFVCPVWLVEHDAIIDKAKEAQVSEAAEVIGAMEYGDELDPTYPTTQHSFADNGNVYFGTNRWFRNDRGLSYTLWEWRPAADEPWRRFTSSSPAAEDIIQARRIPVLIELGLHSARLVLAFINDHGLMSQATDAELTAIESLRHSIREAEEGS